MSPRYPLRFRFVAAQRGTVETGSRTSGHMLKSYAILLLGTLFASQSVIFINLCKAPPATLTGWRGILGALLLSPAFYFAARKFPREAGWTAFRRALVPGILFALHLITWTIGSRITTVAHAILIICMVPLVMPIVIMFLIRERITRHELAGTIVAFIGILVLTSEGFMAEGSTLTGDFWCLVSMLCYCLYLALARANRDISSVWLYVPPLYLIMGVICLTWGAIAGAYRANIGEVWWGNWPVMDVIWLLCLVFVPTIVGHTMLNLAMRLLRGQVVAIGNLAQVIFASVSGWLVLNQTPKPTFYIAVVLVLLGMLVSMMSLFKPAKPWEEHDATPELKTAAAKDA